MMNRFLADDDYDGCDDDDDDLTSTASLTNPSKL
jgi:hypothetical protein